MTAAPTTALPQTPADCLEHCRNMLSDLEYRLALAKIECLVLAERHAATVAAINKSYERAAAAVEAVLANGTQADTEAEHEHELAGRS